MKMKKLATILMTVSVLAGAVTVSAAGTDRQEPYSGEYMNYDNIVEYISDYYIDNYSKEEIVTKGLSELLSGNDPLLIELLKATFESLDDYSEFYTEEEYKEYEDALNHTFYGIGIIMQLGEDGYVEITGFVEGSDNAQKAGFQIGDKFLKVNGNDVTGQSVAEVRSQVIGEEGTTVNITVLREGSEKEISVTRVSVNAATVQSAVLEDNIGYISIISFSTDTAAEFEKALDNMRENKVTKIILDLRNNGGGIVPVAIQIAQNIVPKGKIIDVKYRDSKYNVTYNSNLVRKEFDFEVLVNEYTASASEILASAIQDSKAGQLIGTQTFGKAVIQNSFKLQNGSVFKMTVGKYVTRNGKEINKVGLTPDMAVENELHPFDTSGYTQFDYSRRASLGQKNNNVKAAKERLRILGFYKGDVDDIFNAELLEAVKAFQAANSIFSYGVLDAATQKRIEEVISSYSVVDDIQMRTAYELLGGNAEDLYE